VGGQTSARFASERRHYPLVHAKRVRKNARECVAFNRGGEPIDWEQKTCPPGGETTLYRNGPAVGKKDPTPAGQRGDQRSRSSEIRW